MGTRNPRTFPGEDQFKEAVPWATAFANTALLYTGQVIRVSDVGGAGGSLWVWDGSFLRPVGGAVQIAQRWGTVAVPLATLTGITSTAFTLPADIVIPISLIPDHSRIYVHAQVKRTGATATGQLEAYLGTAKTNGDSLLTRVSMNATDAHVGRLDGAAGFATSLTTFVGNGAASPQNSVAGSTTFGDKTTNVNRAAVMYVSLGMSGANAADSFALVGYRVTLEG